MKAKEIMMEVERQARKAGQKEFAIAAWAEGYMSSLLEIALEGCNKITRDKIIYMIKGC